MAELAVREAREAGSLFGVFPKRGQAVVSSRTVARVFEKRHDHVLRDIGGIISDIECAETSEGNAPKTGAVGTMFAPSKYKDAKGEMRLEYLMTRDGFTLLAMGFTGEKALRFKLAYIDRFNEMERFIHSRGLARMECSALTDAVKALRGDDARFYDYRNEFDLINRIVLGMTAKEFKEARGLGEDSSIRDFMSADEVSRIERLQAFEAGLLMVVDDYATRKAMLTAYHNRLGQIRDNAEPLPE